MTHLIPYLELQRKLIEAAMMQHMGGQTMCEVHKDGRVTGGLKYEEGRLVVIGDVIRYAKQHPDNLHSTIITETQKWRSQLERHQSKDQPALTWIAYSQGGVDMYEQLLAWLKQQVID